MPARDSPGAASRTALAALALQFFVNGAIFATLIPRLPEIRDRVGITVGVLGVLLATAGLAGLLGSAAAGPLLGRRSSRTLMVWAGAGMVAVLPVVGLARSPIALLGALALLAFFDVLVDVAMNLHGSRLSARRARPVMNRLHGLWSLGTVAGGVVAAQLARAGVPLPLHFGAVSLVMAVAVVFIALGLPHTDPPAVDESHRPGAGAPTAWTLAGLAVAGGMALTVEVTAGDWAAFRLGDDLDAPAGTAGMAYVAFTAGMTAGRLVGDSIEHRIGARSLFAVSVATAAAGLTTASVVPGQTAALVGYGVAGLGVAPLFPRLYDEAARFPGRPGDGLGAMTAGSRIAGLAAPAVVGLLAATLSVGAAVAVVSLPALACLGVLSLAASRSAGVSGSAGRSGRGSRRARRLARPDRTSSTDGSG